MATSDEEGAGGYDGYHLPLFQVPRLRSTQQFGALAVKTADREISITFFVHSTARRC